MNGSIVDAAAGRESAVERQPHRQVGRGVDAADGLGDGGAAGVGARRSSPT